jgi:hypothetical protein
VAWISRWIAVRWRSPVEAAIDDLRATAAECGAEAGLHDLPDAAFEELVGARLAVLAHKVFAGPVVDPTVLATIEGERAAEREQCLREIEAASRGHARPEPRVSDRWAWRPAVNGVLTVGVVALILETAGVTLGWHGWAAGIVTAALLAVNLPLVHARLARMTASVRETRARRRRLARVRRLDDRIRAARDRGWADLQRQSLAAQWVADHAARVLAEYRLHRARGSAARDRRVDRAA